MTGARVRLPGVLLALAAWVALLRIPFFLIDFLELDEGLYFTIAARLLDGARLYTDLWDNKPVGIFLIYAGVIRAFGASAFAINLGSALAVYGTSIALYFVGRTGFRSHRLGLIAALIFPCYMLDLGAGGANAENFFILFDALSLVVLGGNLRTARGAGQHMRAAALFGLIQGAALQVKFLTLFHTAGMGVIFVAIVLAERHRFRDVVRIGAAFVAGYLLCTALVVGYFAAAGRLDDLVFSNFISPRLYVENPFGLVTPYDSAVKIARRASYFAPLLLFASLLIWLRPRRVGSPVERSWAPIALSTGLTIGAFLGAISTGFAFYHYFITLAPGLSLLAAAGLDRALDRLAAPAGRAAVVAAALAAAYPLGLFVFKLAPQSGRQPHSPSADLAAEIARHAPPGAPVFVIEGSPIVYGLSRTVPATRYPFAYHILDRPQAYGVDPIAEIDRAFAVRPVLVVTRESFLAGRHDAVGDRIRQHLESYRRVTVGPAMAEAGFVLFQL